MRYLVIDEFSAEILSQSSITDEWFSAYGKPEGVTSLHRIHIDDIIFFISSKSDEHTRLLIVDLRDDPFRTVPSPSHAFDRILVGALAQFSSRVSIPATWKYFHDDHRFSVYAQPKGVGHGQRIYFDRDLADGHIQVVAITPDTRDFSEVPDGNELSRACASKYIDALIKRDALDVASATLDHTAGAFGIVLEKPIGAGFIQRGTLSEWLGRLTPRQRQFVDARADQPVRLKGVPGTGKTLCLTIKALREVFSANATERHLRVAFLTHSSSVAHHVVEGMLSILDPDGSRNANPSCTFWLGSLYELIAEVLDYAGKGNSHYHSTVLRVETNKNTFSD